MSKLLQNSSYYKVARNQNLHHLQDVRVYTRNTAFENTLKVLEDPKNNRKLYLIGTLNSSDALAKRTERLLETIPYTSLLVQTNVDWYKSIKNFSHNIEV